MPLFQKIQKFKKLRSFFGNNVAVLQKSQIPKIKFRFFGFSLHDSYKKLIPSGNYLLIGADISPVVFINLTKQTVQMMSSEGRRSGNQFQIRRFKNNNGAK